MSALVKPVALILGLVLLLIGILGFVMESPLFGLFVVNPAHNIVHLASGLLALLAAKSYTYSKWFLIIFGIVYGAVAVLGFLSIGPDGTTVSLLNVVDVNGMDNYLHIGIALLCLIVGFGSKGKSAM